MIDRISARFSGLTDRFEETDQRELNPDELQALIDTAEAAGYTLEDARDLKSPQDGITSELYAAWYAKENGIRVFEDNVPNLIELRASAAPPGKLAGIAT